MARVSHVSKLAALSISSIAALALLTTVAKASLGAVPAASCTSHAYAYAGLVSNEPAQGIEAVVTTVAAAQVSAGHVAGWIGVGGTTAGSAGQAEWLQTGVNTMAGGKSELYAEITQPGRPTRYITLASNIRPGSSYRLSVVELPGTNDLWQVRVNGKAATQLIHLPGSSRFQPMAMSESWNGGTPGCNGFIYRFSHVRIATGSWHTLASASVRSDLGYKVVDRTVDGFTALSG